MLHLKGVKAEGGEERLTCMWEKQIFIAEFWAIFIFEDKIKFSLSSKTSGTPNAGDHLNQSSKATAEAKKIDYEVKYANYEID